MEENKSSIFLVTTKEWFYGPDGELYRAVLGRKRKQDNDFLNMGSNENNIGIPWKNVASCILLKDDEYPRKKDIFII